MYWPASDRTLSIPSLRAISPRGKGSCHVQHVYLLTGPEEGVHAS